MKFAAPVALLWEAAHALVPVRNAGANAFLAAPFDHGGIAALDVHHRVADNNIWLYTGLGVTLCLLVAGAVAFLILRSGSGKVPATASPDTTVVLHSTFDVLPQRMAQFKACCQEFYSCINPEQEQLLYFGFTVDETSGRVAFREAYKNAAGVLAHLHNTETCRKDAMKISALEKCEVHGPADEVEKLREAMGPFNCKFYVADAQNVLHGAREPASWGKGAPDLAIYVIPRFKVPLDRLTEFCATFEAFHASTQHVEEGLLNFGFAVEPDNGMVLAYGGHMDAEGVLKHLENTDAVLKQAGLIGDMASMEVHGPLDEIQKLRSPLSYHPGVRFFATDSGCRTWCQLPSPRAKFADPLDESPAAGDADLGAMMADTATRLAEQAKTKVEKGSALRGMVEDRATSFTDKAKDFVINELNNTASALLKAVDAEEASMLLDFNQAVEASFPPISVLLAGVTSPALLTMSQVAHLSQLFVLFLPIFVGTSLSLYEDHGVACDIPTMVAWTWFACILSFLLTLGHASLGLQIHAGQNALKAKTAEVSARIAANAEDGETGISDFQDIFIGSSLLVQEALVLEDRIRRSFWGFVIGACTLLWIFAALWNCVIIIGWTFVPGTIAFHEDAHEVAAGDFCGAWASVFTGRVVCLLTPLFFFVNIIQVVHWAVVTLVHSDGVSTAVLNAAKGFDDKNGGVPVATTLVKAFVLRASSDATPARLTIALGEALRLSKEKADLETKLEEVQARIIAGKAERKSLRTLARVAGDSMQANVELLENAAHEDIAAWKEKGVTLVAEAEKRAAASQQVATDELDKIMEYMTDLADKVQNHEMVKTALEQAKQKAAEAKAAAEAAAAQAQELGEQAAAQASEAAAQAQAYANSPEAMAKLEQARGLASQASQSGMEMASQAAAQAQTAAQAGLAEAQSAAQAGMAQAESAARTGLAQAQTAAQAGLADASRAAEKAKDEAAKAKKKFGK